MLQAFHIYKFIYYSLSPSKTASILIPTLQMGKLRARDFISGLKSITGLENGQAFPPYTNSTGTESWL